ncbi:biopolymer transport protein ExbB [Thermotomaculum hydrothermale]|uniref:Biopolymer transport protein ExbB n=1 Tax=Thermotomaculum hydrothermale TaxID=981385 RepID=A0A7R6SYH6_9BACT|nr:MotA/TolQ/ExbB proton channel family protein [Thermotomaculum hydrothermale]BBB32789.1 biopolymer transport protein ExbB [Thermotomaculum hydrothermale]
MEAFTNGLMEYMDKGGPIMYVLALFSIMALVVIIWKGFILYKARINTSEFLGRLKGILKKKNVKAAIDLCEEYKSPIASILKAGLIKFGRPQEEVEKAMENAAIHEIARLEKGLGILASVANLAPMLGFLGTVTGMIQSFDAMSKLNDPGKVAEGISEALITTAGGLIVAVPVLMFYNYYTSLIAGFIREIESASNVLLETFGEIESLQ